MTGANGYHMVLLVTEKDMQQLYNEKPAVKGVPEFFCVMRNGAVLFYPPFDPKNARLMCAEGVV